MAGVGAVDEKLWERLRRIEVMMFDVDGVLTDGRLFFGESGETIKVFDVRDGHGLKALRRAGIATAIVSGRTSTIVARRAAELDIDQVLQGVEDKGGAVDALLARLGKPAEAAGFMGDDL